MLRTLWDFVGAKFYCLRALAACQQLTHSDYAEDVKSSTKRCYMHRICTIASKNRESSYCYYT